ncbi:flagellar hook capping FlgD N-terminal domain-containing protein [Sulfurospirillum oryzae]|uniref:flagellar hook capping FlgD N-terminal domain-containing protein n=1 Tax=Sulfurospirillum oryzae TaxID=2976535 RepID=UPI0021E8DB97|nr:flagellar hook capping FlgD N-terminal domain-containing protein [Sulfurospirillum oryzae]
MATTSTKGYESLITPGTASSTTTTAAAKTGSSDTLGKDDFLKLLLTELQHQDPTSPMDSDKILTQTSQLATLESATKTNTALDNLSTQLKESVSANATSVIGKMGSIGSDAITLSSGKSTYEVYFPTAIKTGTLTIADKNGATVKTVDLSSVAAGKSGVLSFDWDGTDNSGTLQKDGAYRVTATYVDAAGASKTTAFGVYPVESIRYDSGSTYVKLGSQYYAMSDVVEFYDK